jgi:hypothetical protein
MQLIRGCETECDITMPQLHSTTGTFTLLLAQPNRPNLPVSVLPLFVLCLRQNAMQENGQNRGEALPRIARSGVKTLLREIDRLRCLERAQDAA